MRGIAGRAAIERELDGIADHQAAMKVLQAEIDGLPGGDRIAAVGHRIVHGGVRYTRPERVDEDLLRELERRVALAPLHQPYGLAAIRSIAQSLPGVPLA